MSNSSKGIFSQLLSDVESQHCLICYLALLFIDFFSPWNKIKRSYQWLCCGWKSKHFDGYLNLLFLLKVCESLVCGQSKTVTSQALCHTSLLLKAPVSSHRLLSKTYNSMRVLAKQKYLIKSVMVHDSQSKWPLVTLLSFPLKSFIDTHCKIMTNPWERTN